MLQQSKFYFLKFLVTLSLIFSSNFALALEKEPILFGVMSLAQPARIYQQWQPFVDYVSEKSGHKIKIVIPRGFKKIKNKIANKQVDMFYTNSYVFYRLQKAGKALAIAQMQNLEGSIMSNSVIFVRGDSGINNMQDLRNNSMAFVSPAGAGGYLAPRALFHKEGIDTRKEVKAQFTKNLSSSISKVLLGDAKAGTMCGLNYKLMGNKINTGELKIIATSEDYPENMIGMRPGISKKTRQDIAKIILNMTNDNIGKKVLAGMRGMKIQAFVKPSDITTQRTKELLTTAKMKQ